MDRTRVQGRESDEDSNTHKDSNEGKEIKEVLYDKRCHGVIDFTSFIFQPKKTKDFTSFIV